MHKASSILSHNPHLMWEKCGLRINTCSNAQYIIHDRFATAVALICHLSFDLTKSLDTNVVSHRFFSCLVIFRCYRQSEMQIICADSHSIHSPKHMFHTLNWMHILYAYFLEK